MLLYVYLVALYSLCSSVLMRKYPSISTLYFFVRFRFLDNSLAEGSHTVRKFSSKVVCFNVQFYTKCAVIDNLCAAF